MSIFNDSKSIIDYSWSIITDSRNIINDSRSIFDNHKRYSKFWCHFGMTLEVSFRIVIFL
jgi:hypothetical protein